MTILLFLYRRRRKQIAESKTTLKPYFLKIQILFALLWEYKKRRNTLLVNKKKYLTMENRYAVNILKIIKNIGCKTIGTLRNVTTVNPNQLSVTGENYVACV